MIESKLIKIKCKELILMSLFVLIIQVSPVQKSMKHPMIMDQDRITKIRVRNNSNCCAMFRMKTKI